MSTSVQVPAWRTRLRADVHTPPDTGLHTARPTAGPDGGWRRALEEERVSGKLTPSQVPHLAHLWDAPRSRCDASSGLGDREPAAGVGVSGVASSLAGWHPPMGAKAETPTPSPTPHPHFSEQKRLPLGAGTCQWACMLCLPVCQAPNGSLFPCRKWCIRPPPRASSKALYQATMPLSLPMAPQVRRSPGDGRGLSAHRPLALHQRASPAPAWAGIKDMADPNPSLGP